MEWYGMDDRDQWGEGSCEQDDEPSGSIKYREIECLSA
jgi:hypothetical protein